MGRGELKAPLKIKTTMAIETVKETINPTYNIYLKKRTERMTKNTEKNVLKQEP